MDINNPRKWYYALMDYGVMLKKTHPELNKRSAHYRKQSKFKGSSREVRGKILKLLLTSEKLSEQEIMKKFNKEPGSLRKILKSLSDEGFVREEEGFYYINN